MSFRKILEITATQLAEGYKTMANGVVMTHRYDVIAVLGNGGARVWEPAGERLSRTCPRGFLCVHETLCSGAVR